MLIVDEPPTDKVIIDCLDFKGLGLSGIWTRNPDQSSLVNFVDSLLAMRDHHWGKQALLGKLNASLASGGAAPGTGFLTSTSVSSSKPMAAAISATVANSFEPTLAITAAQSSPFTVSGGATATSPWQPASQSHARSGHAAIRPVAQQVPSSVRSAIAVTSVVTATITSVPEVTTEQENEADQDEDMQGDAPEEPVVTPTSQVSASAEAQAAVAAVTLVTSGARSTYIIPIAFFTSYEGVPLGMHSATLKAQISLAGGMHHQPAYA